LHDRFFLGFACNLDIGLEGHLHLPGGRSPLREVLATDCPRVRRFSDLWPTIFASTRFRSEKLERFLKNHHK
ncbi:MAG: hypothetical protein ACRCSU_09495, partial [Paracoccaceae bacterium]